MSTAAVRLAARLSRREVRHRPWRSLLVVLLVAVPVAGMTLAVVLVRSGQLTALETWHHDNGAADGVLLDRWDPGSGRRIDPGADADLPGGTRVVSYETMQLSVRRAGRRGVSAEVTNLPLADPLTAGIVRITGRAPERASEVLLSGHAARRLGVGVGDTVDLRLPIQALVTVVGLGERGGSRDANLLVLHGDVPFPGPVGREPSWTHLVDLPDRMTAAEIGAWAAVPGRRLAPGLNPLVPAAQPVGHQSASIRWSWIAGAVVLTVAGIVIASAFAAGARRQLTTLGQLAANGAPPRTLKLVLVLQGTWTGVFGALLGLVLGAAALAALASRRDSFVGHHVDGYDVKVVDLVPIVLLGVAAATIAALIPARSASRLPVLASLAGRRPLGPASRSLTASGVAACVGGLLVMALATIGATPSRTGQGGGAAWGLTAIVGAIALLLGVCAAAPGYVGLLGRASSRLSGSCLLAARSLARQRSRTAAVVSAVCVAAALPVAMSASVRASQASNDQVQMPADRVLVGTRTSTGGSAQAPIPAPPPELVNRLRAVLPGAEAQRLSFVPLDLRRAWVAGLAEPALLDTYGYQGEIRRALARTGIVSLSNSPMSREQRLIVQGPGRQAEEVFVPVVTTVVSTPGTYGLLQALITPQRAAELGLQPEPGDVLLRMSRALTAAQRAAVERVDEGYADEQIAAMSPSGTPASSMQVGFRRPASSADPVVLDAVLAAMALAFTLFVVASSLALSAAETRDERDVLSVIGASPRTLRRISGAKAVIVTFLGVSLALPVGLLPALIVTRFALDGWPFVFPWRVVGLLAIGMPLVAGVATTAASAVALHLRPARVSTLTFE